VKQNLFWFILLPLGLLSATYFAQAPNWPELFDLTQIFSEKIWGAEITNFLKYISVF
jgi:hypothetical protein